MNNESGTPPRRVRVTSPRTTAGRPHRKSLPSEIDAQTRLGEIYVSSLLRAQLRLAAMVILGLLVLIGGLPLAYWLFPGLEEIRILNMPLAWVLLGFGVYPLLFGLGWLYVRAAESNERVFTDMMDRP